MSTHALASLTANYTDSEPEAEEEDKVLQDDDISTKSSEEESSRGASVEPVKIPELPRVTNLVSYHDDAAEEDEDEVTESRGHDATDSPPHDSAIVELPPEPTGRVSPRIAEKITQLHDTVKSGLDMNDIIQNRKDFRNPSIYEKLIQFCGINELGTNYPPRIYDPLKWGKESFYEEISKVQKTEMEKREKDKKDKMKVEFVVGTKKANSLEEELKKRKSKWDQVAGQGTAHQVKPAAAGLLPPTFTNAISGTKSTVISAFGSLPKKPKI